MPDVLITGASGFIGSHLCDAFLAAGYRVHGLVRRSSDLRFLRDRRVHLVYGDLTSVDAIDFPGSLDAIVHAAALVSDSTKLDDLRAQVLGITVTLVNEVARRYPRLDRFVYISSALVLGYCADGISEEKEGRPVSYLPYSVMKRETEKFLFERHGTTGFPVVILRPGDVYGPRDRTSSENMLKAAEQGVPLRVGSGRWKFALCSHANLCQAAVAAVKRSESVGKAYTVVNGIAPTWREFFDALQEGVGRPQRVYVPVSVAMIAALAMELARRLFPRLQPPINFYRIRRITSQTTYDISRTVRELGYAPDDDYAGLFRSIVEWYKQEKAGLTA